MTNSVTAHRVFGEGVNNFDNDYSVIGHHHTLFHPADYPLTLAPYGFQQPFGPYGPYGAHGYRRQQIVLEKDRYQWKNVPMEIKCDECGKTNMTQITYRNGFGVYLASFIGLFFCCVCGKPNFK